METKAYREKEKMRGEESGRGETEVEEGSRSREQQLLLRSSSEAVKEAAEGKQN
jgi:hypothetical protein